MTEDIATYTFDHNGMKVHFIPTKKFKTIQFAVKFKAPLNRETITKRSLLTFILEQGTKEYPSERKLIQYLDELYGAVFSVEGQKKGNEHIITFRLEVANDKYIAGEQSIVNQAVKLLHDLIFAPYQEGGQFPEKIIAREKRTLTDRIEAIKDDKMSYANMRLIDEMCKNESYGIHALGYIEDLEHIDSDSIGDYYQTMIKNNMADFYIVGDVNTKELRSMIEAQFKEQFSRNRLPTPKESAIQEKAQEIIEAQQVNQAKLHIGYRTNITYEDEDYFALHVFNGLFGGFPSSKLFMNVREKHSLAYYAASRIESHKGLLLVFSGIESENYKQAKDIIDAQLQAMIDGSFTERELENIKALIISDIKETLDHLTGTIELLYQQVVGQKIMLPKDFMEGIMNVTKADVVRVAEKLVPDTTYLLTSREEERNEKENV